MFGQFGSSKFMYTFRQNTEWECVTVTTMILLYNSLLVMNTRAVSVSCWAVTNAKTCKNESSLLMPNTLITVPILLTHCENIWIYCLLFFLISLSSSKTKEKKKTQKLRTKYIYMRR